MEQSIQAIQKKREELAETVCKETLAFLMKAGFHISDRFEREFCTLVSQSIKL